MRHTSARGTCCVCGRPDVYLCLFQTLEQSISSRGSIMPPASVSYAFTLGCDDCMVEADRAVRALDAIDDGHVQG